jgi:hypothetical protein
LLLWPTYLSAAKTRSGVIGRSYSRLPVASKKALAMAAPAAASTSSPAPDGGWSGSAGALLRCLILFLPATRLPGLPIIERDHN